VCFFGKFNIKEHLIKTIYQNPKPSVYYDSEKPETGVSSVSELLGAT
jgi:hypothetical protein|tara:strand:+ start:843 stop:983 length:141 start_codon:yes stop_codon:yes gene_type:complete